MVATAVLFSSAFPGMFNTFIRWQFQRTYDAMLAAPVDVEELITAEVLWISLRAGVYGLAPLLVGFAFGLEPNAGMLLVPLIGFVTGFGFAAFGVTIAAVAKTIDNFNYITSAVLTPMFLVAGTFFPISSLPDGVRTGGAGEPALPLRAARARRVARRPRLRRPGARGGARCVRADHVAPGDPPARQAPDRLERSLGAVRSAVSSEAGASGSGTTIVRRAGRRARRLVEAQNAPAGGALLRVGFGASVR